MNPPLSYFSRRCYEDIEVGDSLPTVVKGPLSPAHLVRWCGAIENWHRIHYDTGFATVHEGLPERLVNGSWKQHLLVQVLKDWAGSDGWVWKLSFQFRGMDVVWDTLTGWGRVIGKEEVGGLGFIKCEIGIENQKGVNTTQGSAVVVVPLRAGSDVPYPFNPPAGLGVQ